MFLTTKVKHVIVTDEALTVDLNDGRTVTVPLAWYLRIFYGKPQARMKWRLIGNGEGIHWSELDEDISVENLITGKPSGESQRSFKRWLEEYTARRAQPEILQEEVAV